VSCGSDRARFARGAAGSIASEHQKKGAIAIGNLPSGSASSPGALALRGMSTGPGHFSETTRPFAFDRLSRCKLLRAALSSSARAATS